MKPLPTRERISELFYYQPETGVFWSRKWDRRAGYAGVKGYRQITIDGFRYMEHRLAWFLVHGTWPLEQIDHINQDKGDNRIANLRAATQSQNRANSKVPVTSISGIKGVGKTRYSTWKARIRVEGKLIDLGSFKTVEEASAAYWTAAQKSFGEFARRS